MRQGSDCSIVMIIVTGRAQRRWSAKLWQWQPPYGPRCRAARRLSSTPSGPRIRTWGTLQRRSITHKQCLAALDWGDKRSLLHLAYLAFNTGHEEQALGHLKKYLSWIVERGRTWCIGCGQRRGQATPMLTCSGCRVVRFCNKEHQKMASQAWHRGEISSVNGTRISVGRVSTGCLRQRVAWPVYGGAAGFPEATSLSGNLHHQPRPSIDVAQGTQRAEPDIISSSYLLLPVLQARLGRRSVDAQKRRGRKKRSV